MALPPSRLFACWQLKLQMSIGLPIFFCLGYFSLQRFPLREATFLSLSALDRAIPFAPEWFYAYQSLYLFLPIAPLLTSSRALLVRYVRGFVLLCLAGFAVFLLFPVAAPRPQGPSGVTAFDAWMRIEGLLNAFPSLHAGLLALGLLYAREVFWEALEPAARRAGVAIALLWAGLILYATLATKQHYAVDLLAGTLFGAVAWRLSK